MDEERVNEEVKKNSTEWKIGYRIGSIFAYVVAGCATAIVAALTVKFIAWILF